VHGVDAEGQVLIRRKLKRRHVLTFFEKLQPCLVGIEACATSHHWSRELKALGHNVRLMPPAYVKPYVKRQKNDAADAEAICEAVTRANMRFVETKTPDQQSCLMLHRTRQLFINIRSCAPRAARAKVSEPAPVRITGAGQGPGIPLLNPTHGTLGCRVAWNSPAVLIFLRLAIRHEHAGWLGPALSLPVRQKPMSAGPLVGEHSFHWIVISAASCGSPNAAQTG
jgi:hypothetical protein